jgi:hypothetical protein
MILKQIIYNFSIYSYPIITPNSNVLILNWLDRSKITRTKQTSKRITKQAISCYKTHKAKLYQPKPTPARLLTNTWKCNKKTYNITNPNSPDYTIANPPPNKFFCNTATRGK